MLCLTGGEPFLYRDFFEVVGLANELGFPWGVTSNGTLITSELARRLKDYGLGSISISLDGMPSAHDAMRNRAGAFDRALQGVERLLQVFGRDIPIEVTTVVHKRNLADLDALYRLLCERGVGRWKVVNIEPIGRALSHRELWLDPSEFGRLLDFIQEKRFDSTRDIVVTFGCSHYLSLERERMVRDSYFICGAGTLVGSVTCTGDIYACLDIERRPELVQGNVARDDFYDVWSHRFESFRTDRSAQCARCLECEERAWCAGDAAHTWDWEHRTSLTCVHDMLPSPPQRDAS